MAFQDLRIELKNQVATVVISRPKKLNALTLNTKAEIAQVMTGLSADRDVRAVILTGEGEQSFSVGTDVNEMKDLSPGEAKQFIERERTAYASIRDCRKPVIAAINGYALGGGCCLAMACDFRIASEHAVLGLTELEMGVPVPVEGALLIGLVGVSKAKEMIFTASRISAQEANKIGLVNRVVPLPELLPECYRLAERILRLDPRAIALQKEIFNKWMELPLEASIQYSVNAFALAFASCAPKRAIASFLERPRHKS